jgi:hypothetical protein
MFLYMVDNSKDSSMAGRVGMRYIKDDREGKHISEPSWNNADLIVLVLMWSRSHEIFGGDNYS